MMASTTVFALPDAQSSADTTTIPQQSGVEEDTEDIYLIQYEEVASNNDAVLYADMKKGFFAVKSKKTGNIFYSTPIDSLKDEYTRGSDKWELRSQLVIGYLFKEDVLTAEAVQTTNSQMGCVENGSIEVSKIESGIRVVYGFSEQGITIPVTYQLDGNGVRANVELKKIDEGDYCCLTDITLLPAFGAANWEERGHLLVPDGSGALIDFNNGRDAQRYQAMIYGENLAYFKELDSSCSQAVRLPVFATIYENKALMGVVTKGDSSAAVVAVNGNESRGYNAVSSKLYLRSLDVLTMFKRQPGNRRNIGRLTETPNGAESYEVYYSILEDETVTYVDVAAAYRDYLVKEKGLQANPQKPALALEFYGGADKKSAFLGFEYDKTIKLTTFSQAREILEELKNAGIEHITARYLGWGNNGLLNKKLPAKAKPMSALGGKSGFQTLSKYMQAEGYALYPDVDFLQYRSGSNSQAVKNVFNEVVYRNERMPSVFATRAELSEVRLLTPQNLAGLAENFLKSYQKLSVSGISLSTLGRFAYSNNTQKNAFHRYGFASEVEKVLKTVREQKLEIALEDANAYAIPYASRIFNAPTVCSGYDIFDHEIPFYQIVTHGYVTTTAAPMAQSAGAELNLLKAVESGSELLYGTMYVASSVVNGSRYDNLYSTQYSLWKEDAISLYKRYQSLLEEIYDKTITAHYELQQDVMVTVYEGGTTVVTNYNNTTVNIKGKEIGAMDYYVAKEADIA